MPQNEITDYSGLDNGAIPGLDHDENDKKPLGIPSSRTREKSNVNKLVVLGGILVAFLFIIAGLLFWQKNRTPKIEKFEANTKLAPAYKERNTLIDSDSITRTKSELKAREEQQRLTLERENKKQQDFLKAEQEANLKAEQEAEQKSAKARQQTRPNSAVQDSNAITPLTPNERKMQGSVLLSSSGAPLDQNPSEKELQEREFQERQRKAGLDQSKQSQSSLFSSSATNPQSSSSDSLAGRLNSTVLHAARAGLMPNLDYLLKKGTSVPCILKTGINTTLPGFVTCIAQNDVYSANGKTLLVERGASIFGEQQSELKQGQARTFVLWTRIDNPSGVYANIDSPAVDQMGYSGIEGYVETYFWQRFGGAIMLSLIQDFSAAYANRASGQNVGSSDQTFSNSQKASEDMAAQALRNSINIPPTLLVLPGKTINVMVARDVSFESVYELAK